MPNSASQLIQTARRRKEVLQLRESGLTWEACAETMRQRHSAEVLPKGYDRRYAYKDFKRQLQKVNDAASQSAEEVRQVELRRLNRLHRAIWSKALGADETPWDLQKEAIDRVLDLQERRSSYLGLDEPEAVDVTSGGEQVSFIDFRPPGDEEATEENEGTPSGTASDETEGDPSGGS